LPKQTWIASYVFSDEDGSTRSSTRLVTADDYETAYAYAVETAPAAEFVLSMHPQTDEQELGHVGQRARLMKELREDEGGQGRPLRQVLKRLLQDPDCEVGDELDDDGDTEDAAE